MATDLTRREDIPALTSLRFFASLYVVFHHIAPLRWSVAPPVRNFLLNGDSAVEFFFLLSGFILTYSHLYGDGLNVRRGTFYVYRISRIYPVYLLGMVLFTPFISLNLLILHGSLIAVLARITMYGTAACALLQAWVPQFALAWNGPGWSLSTEAFFYAMFPLIAVGVGRMQGRGLAVLWLACWLWSCGPELIYANLAQTTRNLLWIGGLKEFNPLLRLPEFVAGVMVAKRYLAAGKAKFLAADVAAFCVTCVFLITNMYFTQPLEKCLIFNEIAALLYLLAIAKGPFTAMLGTPILVLLGGASYSMYILHIPLYYIFCLARHFEIARKLQPDDYPPLGTDMFVIYVVILIGLSVLSFLFIEQPCSRLLRRMWRSRLQAQGRPFNQRPACERHGRG